MLIVERLSTEFNDNAPEIIIDRFGNIDYGEIAIHVEPILAGGPVEVSLPIDVGLKKALSIGRALAGLSGWCLSDDAIYYPQKNNDESDDKSGSQETGFLEGNEAWIQYALDLRERHGQNALEECSDDFDDSE